MDTAIVTIVETFMKYADGDGNLSKKELENLIENEFSNPEIKDKLPPGKLNKILERADKNKDDALNFGEFCKAMCCMARCHYKKKTGKGGKD